MELLTIHPVEWNKEIIDNILDPEIDTFKIRSSFQVKKVEEEKDSFISLQYQPNISNQYYTLVNLMLILGNDEIIHETFTCFEKLQENEWNTLHFLNKTQLDLVKEKLIDKSYVKIVIRIYGSKHDTVIQKQKGVIKKLLKDFIDINL